MTVDSKIKSDNISTPAKDLFFALSIQEKTRDFLSLHDVEVLFYYSSHDQ